MAIGGSDANDVPLVGNDLIEFILPEKTRQSRIALALLFTRLDRHREVIFAGKPEAHHDMGDRLAGPVHRNEIDRIELAEILRPGLPARREIGFASIIKISHVVNRD